MSSLASRSTRFRFAGLRPAKRRHDINAGIAIGVDRIDFSSMVCEPSSSIGERINQVEWLSQSSFDVGVNPFGPPPDDWVNVVVDRLRERLPRCLDGDRNQAVLSLPLPWIQYQTAGPDEIERYQRQTHQMFQDSLFDSAAHIVQWPILSGSSQSILAATASDAACRIAEVVTEVGYSVRGILPHGIAVLSASTALTSLKPRAALVLETSSALIAMSGDGYCGLTRSLPGPSSPISAEPKLDEIEPWLETIAAEVQATARYEQRLGQGSTELDSEAPLLICGRVANMPGIDQMLASLLNWPVATWRYVGRQRPDSGNVPQTPSTEPASIALNDADLAVPLSLAWCCVSDLDPTRGSQS